MPFLTGFLPSHSCGIMRESPTHTPEPRYRAYRDRAGFRPAKPRGEGASPTRSVVATPALAFRSAPKQLLVTALRHNDFHGMRLWESISQ